MTTLGTFIKQKLANFIDFVKTDMGIDLPKTRLLNLPDQIVLMGLDFLQDAEEEINQKDIGELCKLAIKHELVHSEVVDALEQVESKYDTFDLEVRYKFWRYIEMFQTVTA